MRRIFLAVLLLAAPPFAFAGYRPIDGVGNNVAHPDWGAAGTQLLRGPSGEHYADGLSSLAGPSRPSARVVSNEIFRQEGSIPNRFRVSDYGWTWGQFLDHDIGLTEGTEESAPIAVPAGDPDFDPFATGTVEIPFRRALFDPATGTTTPRQQVNEITAYIDGSNVYGSDAVRAAWLRTMTGGRLKTTSSASGDMLAFNDGTVPNAGSPEVPDFSTTLFVSGDIRVNEQPTLASMHTLFVREHNRLAARIQARHPALDDETIYQRARRLVIAQMQNITYREFLPALLGSASLPPDHGYRADVNPGIASSFSTAAYRIGHTMLSPTILRLGEDGEPIAAGNLALRDAFFDATPPMLMGEGIDPFLRGLAAQRMQELDAKVVDDVRNFLFGPPGAGGFDLVAMNIQRGRDMGLPDFNTAREEFGLPRFGDFAELTSDSELVATLETLYGTVDDVDLFVGLLVEDDRPGSPIGETMVAMLTDQFARLRDGDRFFYTRSLRGRRLARILSTRLSDVIARNSMASTLPRDVFHVRGRGHGESAS